MSTIASSSTLLQDRFAAAMLGVCEEAGVQGLRDRLLAPLLALLCRRLYGVMAQVTRTLARFQAGRLPMRRRPGAARVRIVSDGVVGDAAMPMQAVGLRLRYGWAWMIRLAPRAAQYAPQVQLLLDEPEMQAALAASPSLRRALRPLCRGLAFPTPSVMMEARRPCRRGAGGPAGIGAAVETGIETEARSEAGETEPLPPIRPLVDRHGCAPPDPAGPSVSISDHNARRRPMPGQGSRDSPSVAPAVLCSFAR